MLSGAQAPKFEDTEKSLGELIQRVEKTVAFLNTVKAEQIDGTEDKSYTDQAADGRRADERPSSCCSTASMPNFMFHCTTAYDIMRHNGVELGKRDFMGARASGG